MIHGQKKGKKEKTQQEVKDEEELSSKIMAKLADFFSINKKEIKLENLEKYMEFTTILMQLCSDIPSIYNFRREIIKFGVGLKAEDSEKAKMYASEIKLTTKLIQSDTKSYTIWSYRQWLVLGLFKINPEVVSSEKELCKMLLLKDEKNFHVWNYRNWVNSIQLQIDDQIAFTQEKIKSNPFNFSPYHFRSKFLLQKYSKELENHQNQVKLKEIITYGMPKELLDAEFETVKTAIFLNPNEEAPWIYYNWLLNQLTPAFVICIEKNESETILHFNMKVSDFSALIVSPQEYTLSGSGQINSNKWIVKTTAEIEVKANFPKYVEIKLESTGRRFLGSQNLSSNVFEMKEIHERQINFIDEVIESQEGKCRFALIQKLQIYKARMMCGCSLKEWEEITNKGLQVSKLLLKEGKNHKYIEKQVEYWQRVSGQAALSKTQTHLKNCYKE